MERNDDILTKDTDEPILLRAHHGMCLAYFKGYGYSSGFAEHMQRIKERLDQDAVVKLAAETDIICLKCPNNINGECEKPDLVSRYDTEVLTRCGLNVGEELKYADFASLVEKLILEPGLRSEICGDCQWNELCV